MKNEMWRQNMRLVVFGTGMFYQSRKKRLKVVENIQVCAFLDNNEKLQGTLIDGIIVCSPYEVENIQYDYIVLMSIYATEMYEQLIYLGVSPCKILRWGEFMAHFFQKHKLYPANKIRRLEEKKKVLIVARDIDYSGSTMTAVYAAKNIQGKNYDVDLMAPDGDIRLIHEINGYGINVILCGTLPYKNDEIWYRDYIMVIVNTFPMLQSACEISRYRPVLWWIHEASFCYAAIMREFLEYADKDKMDSINILAVSSIARQNFNTYFPNMINEILCFGIPDMYKYKTKTVKNAKTVFAIIGDVNKGKAQDIFLKAAGEMSKGIPAEFWVIGKIKRTSYGCEILKIADRNPEVKIKGLLTREELYHIFPQIDVVVCASGEETMSIAVVESMMFGRVCITTESTGIVDYIQDGENGFVVPTGDVESLRNRMQWIVDNRNQLEEIGNKARKTYEKYFSMEVFGENLDRALKETVKRWNGKDNKL